MSESPPAPATEHRSELDVGYGARLLDYAARAALASLLLALVELLLMSLMLPAITSRGLGAFVTWLEVGGALLPLALLLAPLAAVLDVPRVARAVPPLGLLLRALALGMLGSMVASVAHRWFAPDALEFRGEIESVITLLVGFWIAGLAFVLVWTGQRWPRLDKPASTLAWAGCLAAMGLAVLVIGYELLQPIGKSWELVPVTALALLLWIVALRLLAPRHGSKGSLFVLGGVVALVSVAQLVPGDARDHARFAVLFRGGGSLVLAWQLRELADRDVDGSAPAWFGGNDCKEGDSLVGPAVREVAGDGVDQDCRGGDAAPAPESTPRDLGQSPPGCSGSPKYSVLLIVVDTLRADFLTPETTPNLLVLAASSQRFTHAYSPTNRTASSFPSLVASRLNSDMGMQNPVQSDAFVVDATLAERFARAGARTAVFNLLDFNTFTLRGFEQRNPYWRDEYSFNVKHELTSASSAKGALEYLSNLDGQRAFVLLHLSDVHAPYVLDTDEQGNARSEVAAYAHGVRYMDLHLGQLFARMKQKGLLDSTVVAVTADHGEELRERGMHGHFPSVFEESVRVPLLVYVPGCAPRVVAEPVSTVRLGPTLAALAGVEHPNPGLYSPSPLPTVVEGAMSATVQFLRAIVVGQFKLIVDVPNGGRMLFDLNADPLEHDDLYGVDPELTARMEAEYQRWLDAPGVR